MPGFIGTFALILALFVLSGCGGAKEKLAQEARSTAEEAEYVWMLTKVKPYLIESFGQLKILGHEADISASDSGCSIRMTEKKPSGEIIERSAVYTLPPYLEANQPFEPSIPVTHSNFEFYCLLDDGLNLSLNDEKTAVFYNNTNGLAEPGKLVGSSAKRGTETHTIIVGMFYDNTKIGAEYVYEWAPKE